MSTYQEVLDHARSYFIDRIANFKGQCQSGWGSCSDPSRRCAIGSMTQGVFVSSQAYFSALTKLLGLNNLDDAIYEGTFYKQIIELNDNHATGKDKYRLTVPEVNEVLMALAAKYNLNYRRIGVIDCKVKIGGIPTPEKVTIHDVGEILV